MQCVAADNIKVVIEILVYHSSMRSEAPACFQAHTLQSSHLAAVTALIGDFTHSKDSKWSISGLTVAFLDFYRANAGTCGVKFVSGAVL